MPKTTIEQLAKATKLSAQELIEHMVEAGLSKKDPSSEITDEEQLQLIGHLRQRKQKPRAAPAAPPKEASASIAPKKTKTIVKRRGALKNTQDSTSKVVTRSQGTEEEQKEETPPSAPEPQAEPKAVSEPQAELKAVPKPKVEPKPKSKSKTSKSKQPSKGNPSSPKPQAAPREFRQLHIDSDKRTTRRKKPSTRVARKPKIDNDPRHGFEKPTKPIKREILIPESLTVLDLAQRMAIKRGELTKMLMNMGMMVTINQTLDQDTATLIVEELGHTAKPEKNTTAETLATKVDVVEGPQSPRPPVVTVMGHVDHGKTSLLDYIRRSQVAESEAGGITQHIGAYHVETKSGMITFLDTPGHEAFTGMRSRGARVTDIIVLVIAADDSVMPQTAEAIEHAKAAKVPVIVALNKIDKEGADPDKVKRDLAQHDITPEDWGGDSIFVEVSAKTGANIDSLLEAISLQAEVMELRSSNEGNATATVIESSRNKERGVAVTLLIRSGTLKKGDVLLAGTEYGKVRALIDENGKQIKSAGPSFPVVVFGMSGTPEAGHEAVVIDSERKARSIALLRQEEHRDNRLARSPAINEGLFSLDGGKKKELRLIIRSDTRGTSEALRDSIEKIVTDEVKVKILSSMIGGITASDVSLSAASQAMIVGFNVRADSDTRKAAESQGVMIRYYSIIYELMDDIKDMITNMLSPEIREEIVGIALVKDVFRSSKLGAVAGCQVTEGAVKSGCPIRVLRDKVVIFEGALESLRRHKDDVSEVKVGTECGIAVKDYNDVKSGDEIEVFQKVEIARTL